MLAASPASAQDKIFSSRTYVVTITNLTRGQIFSPPIVYSHRGHFNLFQLGAPASEQLQPLAEDGDYGPLVEQLTGNEDVLDYTAADPANPESFILPGQSLVMEVTARGFFRYLTLASMLVTTNDGFLALQKLKLPLRGEKTVTVPAYDAGSEANNEDCGFIPGPPCGSGGVRDAADAEGYVHIHAGIHGGADLLPAERDWRNPVALVSVKAQ